MNSMPESYTIRSSWLAVLFEKQEKGFKRVKLSLGIQLTVGEESRSHHADLSEDSERDLFDGRGPSSSEDVTLEEEGMMVTGGRRLSRFLNLSSKLRFLNDERHTGLKQARRR